MTRACFRRHLFAALLCVVLPAPAAAARDRVLIFAAASTAPAIEPLIRDFNAAPVFAASGTLARQIERGAPADLFLSANRDWIRALAKGGHVDATRIVALMRNCLVLVQPRDRTETLTLTRHLPAQIGDGRLLLADPALAPLGAYARDALKAQGLWQALQGRLAYQPNARAVLALAARGEAAGAIVYRSGAMQSTELRIAAALPETAPIVYFLAPVAARDRPAVRQTLDLLQSADARAAYRRAGFLSEEDECPS